MKKLLLAATILALTSITRSQVIFQEDFDGIAAPVAGGAGTYTFPAGWMLRNVDNRTPDATVAYVNDAWERREDFNFNVTDSAAFSTSFYSPTGPANDWMWTPLIGTIPANAKLKWNAVAYDPAYADGYEVRVMTQSSTPGGPTGGTGVIGNQITNSINVFSTAAESSSWTSHEVDLSAFVGQYIWVAFRNVSNDKFILVIDDVTVDAQVDYDASLQAITPLSEYTQIPLPQNPVFTLEANVVNNGAQTLTGLVLNVDVYDASNTNVFSASSAPASLNAGASALLSTTASFAPSTADTFSFVYSVTMAETDQDSSNDSLLTSIIISDSVFARDNDTISGQVGIGTGTGGYIGQAFSLSAPDTLTSVTLGFNGGYTDEPIAAVIFDMSAGVPNATIGGTDTIVYTSTTAGVYTIPVADTLVLPAGEYVIAAIEFDSTLQLSNTTEIFTPGTVWASWSGQPWTNIENFGANFAKSVFLRANFSQGCQDLSITQDTTICFGESITVGTNTYSVSGTYTDIFPNGACDSIVITNLTVNDSLSMHVTVSADGQTATIGATAGASYQWINCDDSSGVSGATDTLYTPEQTGNYAVVVSANGCSDTSDCVLLTEATNSLGELAAQAGFSVSPNPANEYVDVSSQKTARFVLINSIGQEVSRFEVKAGTKAHVAISGLASGLYLVLNTENHKSLRLVIR